VSAFCRTRHDHKYRAVPDTVILLNNFLLLKGYKGLVTLHSSPSHKKKVERCTLCAMEEFIGLPYYLSR